MCTMKNQLTVKNTFLNFEDEDSRSDSEETQRLRSSSDPCFDKFAVHGYGDESTTEDLDEIEACIDSYSPQEDMSQFPVHASLCHQSHGVTYANSFVVGTPTLFETCAPQSFVYVAVPMIRQVPSLEQHFPTQGEQSKRQKSLTSMRKLGTGNNSGSTNESDARDVPDDERTTLMLRNLPNNYTSSMLVTMLDFEGFAGKYDFVYLPMDFTTKASLGYAFVNLVHSSDAMRFWATFDGFTRWLIPSKKIGVVSWSDPHQGLQANIDRYKNSPVMHESVPDEYKPRLLRDGVQIPFPAATRKVRVPRLRKHVH
eukprot:TRINITY_DN1545_c1_g2_i1.p1 TRINITY_DN1545_c1_g2~~TRINITY_DN1545_c1_g2_i1.p1  ORF type:complete len:312 (+),score=46.27 TRINITY_DN1545_c1_g2_i1:51-986(+)